MINSDVYLPNFTQWIYFILISTTVIIAIYSLSPTCLINKFRNKKPANYKNKAIGIGLVIIALISFIGGIIGLVTILNYNNAIIKLPQYLNEHFPFVSAQLQTINPKPTLIPITLGILIGVIGIGILLWQNWARISLIILCLALFILSATFFPYLILSEATSSYLILPAFHTGEIFLIITVVIASYLLKPEVRKFFL